MSALIATERVCVTVCDSGGSFVVFEAGRIIVPDYTDPETGNFMVMCEDDFTEYRYPSKGLVPVSSLSDWERLEFAREIAAHNKGH